MRSTDVRIRVFAEADADEVAALIRTTLLTTNAPDYPLDELESLADWYGPSALVSRMPHCRRMVAVADLDGHQIVGTAARRGARLEGFFVAPAWQRQGIGERLLASLVAEARLAGLPELELDSSVTAVGFYVRLGFAQEGPPADRGEGLVVPMSRTL